MNDPLAKFRNIPEPNKAASNESGGGGEGLPPYEAFKAVDKTKRLQIRRVLGATHSPAYTYLLDVSYDGFHGTELVLTYSFMLIKIKGINLQPIILAIEKHECAFIQDYDPQFFAPSESDKPFIENIEIVERK